MDYHGRLKPIKINDIQKIHENSLDILSTKGMRFQSRRAREIFLSHGFRIEGEIVYIGEKEIENTLKTVPEKFTLLARNPDHNLEVGGDNFAFAPSGGSPFILDSDGICRVSTREDYENSLKLTQMLKGIDFNYELVSAGGTNPCGNILLYELLASIKLTDKPLSCDDARGVELLSFVFGMNKREMREQSIKGKAYGISNINPISPLTLGESESNRLIDSCQWGIALGISPMPLAGITAPCTLPGLLISQNCEILGTLVLTQLVNPGCPVLYGCIGTIADMKNTTAPIGTPETRLIELASAQMADFYKLPTRGDVGLTDAHDLDFQAGAESMMHFINAVRGGLNLLPGLGALGSWNTGSLEKLVLDAELAEYEKRLLRPLEFSEETMAVDLIKKVGSQGTYIAEEHTFNHFRQEFYEPMVFSREVYSNWEKGGKKELKIKARERVEELLKNYERPFIEKPLVRDLENYAKANNLD